MLRPYEIDSSEAEAIRKKFQSAPILLEILSTISQAKYPASYTWLTTKLRKKDIVDYLKILLDDGLIDTKGNVRNRKAYHYTINEKGISALNLVNGKISLKS